MTPQWQPSVDALLAQHAGALDQITPKFIFNHLDPEGIISLERIQSDAALKGEIKKYATACVARIMEPPPQSRKRAAVVSDKKVKRTRSKSPPNRKSPRPRSLESANSVSKSDVLPKLIQLYKQRGLYRKVKKDSPNYSTLLQEALLDALLEKGIIKTRAMPSLAEAKRWREKNDMEEELNDLNRDLARHGLDMNTTTRRKRPAGMTALLAASSSSSSSDEDRSGSAQDSAVEEDEDEDEDDNKESEEDAGDDENVSEEASDDSDF